MLAVGNAHRKAAAPSVFGRGARRKVLNLAGRVLSALALLLVGSLVVFLTIKAAPGDPALSALGEQATPEAIAAFEAWHGLDRPILVQYVHWLRGVVTGDFGVSITMAGGEKVSTLLAAKLPVTVFLGIYALTLAIVISLALGTFAARHRGGVADIAATFVAILGISMPDFWLSYVLIFFFGLWLDWFPTFGYVSPGDDLSGAIHAGFLPALAIAAPMAALFSRILRAVLLETMNRPYVVAARSFGLKQRFIFLHFVFRNAPIPYLTVIGLQIRYILGGVVVVERIFGIPGVGSFMVDGAFARSDAVSLHLALTPETRGMLSVERLALMRPGAILVNTARAGLIDTRAMIAALEQGRLAHAVLDVFDREPLPADDPLLSAPNVTLTAHAAFKTREAVRRLVEAVVDVTRRTA